MKEEKERSAIFKGFCINTALFCLFMFLEKYMNHKVYLGISFIFLAAYVILFRMLWIYYRIDKKYELLNFDFNGDIKNQLPELDDDKIKDFLRKVSKYNVLNDEEFIRIIVEEKKVYIEDFQTERKELLDYSHIKMADKWFEEH